MKIEAKKKYVCTKSASPGYKKGSVYEAYLNKEGRLCFMGDDGFEDICSNLISTFTEHKED